jgi:hypothetical protein
LNFLSDNKSLAELPVGCLLVIGFTAIGLSMGSSSFEQDATERNKTIASNVNIFFKVFLN